MGVNLAPVHAKAVPASRLERQWGAECQLPTPPAQGLEWVLQMYSSGAVRDYRFAYDFMAPSLPELLRALGSMQEQREAQQAERRARRAGAAAAAAPARQGSLSDGEQEQQGAVAAAGGEGEQPAALRRRRSLQPLLPAACAMALLPRGGRMHAGGTSWQAGLGGVGSAARALGRRVPHSSAAPASALLTLTVPALPCPPALNAATALQHLMDEGSELEEIYAVCEECAALGQRVGAGEWMCVAGGQ